MADALMLRNRTFDQLRIGDAASLTRSVGERDIALFAAVSGDINPGRTDPARLASVAFGDQMIHGLWTTTLVSTVLDTELPGPGTIIVGQQVRFRKPARIGDRITTTVKVTEKGLDGRTVTLEFISLNQRGEEVLSGTANVLAPMTSIAWPRMPAPEIAVQAHGHYLQIVKQARAFGALRTAVVHPCSAEALAAALEAKEEGMLDPVLIGPEHKIRAAADAAGLSLDGLEIEHAEHSHAAAARGVELAAQHKVVALMKGSLHSDELLSAVVAPGAGLQTGRRISHVYAMDVPLYYKPLIVTDAAVNILPTLAHKRDICQNAVDLLHLMGVPRPHVAILAAVETVNPEMRATLDAAALTVMAARGQIEGARVDGPLAFDNAISTEAARTKNIISEVAGSADILLVPDLEAGNMLAKQLIYLAGADAAGLVLGARVPVILTSRADPLRVRLASIALARMVVKK